MDNTIPEEMIQAVAQKLGEPVETIRENARAFEREINALKDMSAEHAAEQVKNIVETINRLEIIFMRNVRKLLADNALLVSIFDIGVVVGVGVNGEVAMDDFIGHPKSIIAVSEHLVERGKKNLEEFDDGQGVDVKASKEQVQSAE